MLQTFPAIKITQREKIFYLTRLPASTVTLVSYASVRGRDNERGSVQRVLNTRRISGIKEFALNGGNFPNSVVLNWVKENITVDEDKSLVSFELEEQSAQLIDGQHRVAGLKEAISDRPDFGSYELPVAIYVGLSTKDCADIFLAINTEQKPVHRSLVFDLYEIADDQIVDQAAARARDIALELNEFGAPYHGMIKFPGEEPRKGGVSLSTVVSSIKPLIEKNGVFDQVGLSTLENQTKAVGNFFLALRSSYGHLWSDRQNAFLYAAGFAGAIDFLAKRIVPFCVKNKSFSDVTIKRALQLGEGNAILQRELSGKGGSESQRHIFARLDECFSGGEEADDYEF